MYETIHALPELPETIKYDMQPYTYGAVLTDLEWITSEKYRPMLRGIVQSGTRRAFLYGASAARDISGEPVNIYGVSERELASGHIVRVAS